jgi:hypothetical protein
MMRCPGVLRGFKLLTAFALGAALGCGQVHEPPGPEVPVLPEGCGAGMHDGGGGRCVPEGTCSPSYHPDITGTCVANCRDDEALNSSLVCEQAWFRYSGPTIPRAAPAVLLADGRVGLLGGENRSNQALSGVELFDPVSTTWSPAGRLLQARKEHAVTLLADGRVLVTGGLSDDASSPNRPILTAELYDAAARESRWTTQMPRERVRHKTLLLQDGRVALFGGALSTTIDIFDPVLEAWESIPHQVLPGAEVTLLPSGKVLVSGGLLEREPVDTAALFDPVERTFTPTARMSFPRAHHDSVVLPSGEALITRRYRASYPPELYHPESDTWTTVAVNEGTNGVPVLAREGSSVLLFYCSSARLLNPVQAELRYLGAYQDVSNSVHFCAREVLRLPDGALFLNESFEPTRLFRSEY